MNQESRIALYTIVNKRDIFEDFKLNLEQQKNIEFELYEIDNCNGEYNSARKAFNDNAKSEAEYYIFLHPDIRFIDDSALADIINEVDSINDFGVIGIAGARKQKKTREIVSNIIQGKNMKRVGTYITEPMLVQTVDECFFIIKKEYFKYHKFSEKIGWHLYGVEYSLNTLRDGKKNYVVPSRVWHMSSGNSLDEKYMSQLEDIIQENKKEYRIICTTVKAWKTTGLKADLYRKYYWLKQMIKKELNIISDMQKDGE